MGGGLLDLVAKGGQDVYFICNPEISFFKKVYKRHTNFAFENHKYQFDGEVTFGSRTTMNISRTCSPCSCSSPSSRREQSLFESRPTSGHYFIARKDKKYRGKKRDIEYKKNKDG